MQAVVGRGVILQGLPFVDGIRSRLPDLYLALITAVKQCS